jgi:chromosome partitioning protein
LLDTTLGVPRFAGYLRQYRVHANAPLAGEVITATPDTRRTAAAIWDAMSVGFELSGRLSQLRKAG